MGGVQGSRKGPLDTTQGWTAVIIVTRLNGPQFSVNPDLLQRIDSAPDTILTLVDGTKYIVEESMPQVIDLITTYRATLVARAQDVQQKFGLHVAPDPTDDESAPLARPVPLRPRRK
jgi:flagellar protein FlbD